MFFKYYNYLQLTYTNNIINKNKIMSEIDYNSIKRKIENLTCVEHKKNPVFINTTNGFEIHACCDKFRNEVGEKAKEMFFYETQKLLEKPLKNIFKN